METLARLLASGLAEETTTLSIHEGAAVKRPVLASSYAVHRRVRFVQDRCVRCQWSAVHWLEICGQAAGARFRVALHWRVPAVPAGCVHHERSGPR